MLKFTSTIVAISWTVFLAFISLMSLENAPKISFSFADKIVHVAVYFIFSIVWFFAFDKGKTTHFLQKNAILLSAIFGIVYGILIEIMQETLVDNRQGDWKDALANTIGTLFAVIVIKMFFQKNRKLKTHN